MAQALWIRQMCGICASFSYIILPLVVFHLRKLIYIVHMLLQQEENVF